MRAAVFRPASDVAALVASLHEVGVACDAVPLIETVAAVDGGAALDAELERIDRYRWLALTSAAGARFVAASARRLSLQWPSSLRVAVVGAATARAAESAGLRPRLVPARATATALAATFPAPDVGQDSWVLAALAELASDDLVTGLTTQGWNVKRVTAYRTTQTAVSAEQVSRVAACTHGLYTSPSIVDAAIAGFGWSGLPPVTVCIGPKTAERAKRQHLPAITVAEEHSNEGLVQALIAVSAR